MKFFLLLSLSILLLLPRSGSTQTPPDASPAATSAFEWNRKGMDAYDTGRFAEAAEDFQKALTLAPVNRFRVIALNLTRAYRGSEQFAKAVMLLEYLRKTASTPTEGDSVTAALVETHFEWAVQLGKIHDDAGAGAQLQAVVKIAAARPPGSAARTLNTVGMAYADNLHLQMQAIAIFQQGILYARQAQDMVVERKLLNNLGYAYEAQKQYADAMAAFAQELVLAQKAEDRPTQIRLLDHMGDIQFVRESDYPRAAELFEQELVLLSTGNDTAARLETLNRLQTLYFLSENYEKTADTRVQQMIAQRAAGDAAGARKTLGVLGSLYFKAGLYEKAIPFYEELRAQQQAEGDRAGEARTLNGLAGACVKRNQPERALDLLEKSLALYQALGDRVKIARTLVDLGAVHIQSLHEADAGIALYIQALAMQREDHDEAAEGRTLSALGPAYAELDRYAQSLEFSRQALVIQQRIRDDANAAKTLNNIGLAQLKLNQPEDALTAFQMALPLLRQVKNREGEIFALTGIGSAYSDLSDYPQALAADRQVLALDRARNDKLAEAVVLNNMVEIYRNQGNYAEALQTMKQVAAVFQTLGDAKNEATTQMNLGEIYSELGQWQKAIEYYTQALAVQTRIGDESGMEVTLGNLGAASANLGQYEKAAGYYMQSLTLARQRKDRAGEATALTNMGIVQGEWKQTQKAVDSFRQALVIFAEIKDVRSAAVTLNDLGVVLSNSHQTAQAVEVYTQALQTMRRIGDRDGQAATLANLMLLWQPTRPGSATWCGKAAVNIYQEIRGSLKAQTDDPEGQLQRGGLQQAFAASRESVYRNLADILITQGRLTEAREVLRMLKQEEYFDFLGRDPSSAPVQQQRVTLTADEAEGAKRYAALGGGAPLTPLFEAMALALAASRRTPALIPQSSETGGLSRSLAGMEAGTVALVTIVEPGKYRVMIVTPHFQHAVEYPIAAKDLYRKVFALRNALQDPTRDPRPLAHELYKILLGPLEADLRDAHATTLLWSLDDALRYLPLAALHDGKQYLVERYSMGLFTPAGENRLARTAAPPWRGLGLGVSQAHDDFPALPGVTQELSGIVSGRLLPGTVLLDGGFTRKTLTAALAQNRGADPRWPVIHIASHFALSSRDTNSFLLLGDGRHLSVAQIKTDPHFFQGVDLLTLSACNTAIDVKTGTGREVEGFGALAQRLGARSVLASLWPVADASTPTLMREFYRLRRASRTMSKAAGLRQAQLELLRGKITASTPPSKANRAQRAKIAGAANTDLPLFTADPKAPYAHPFYWAPFVLIGNPQ